MNILVIGSEHRKNRLGASLMTNGVFNFHYKFNPSIKYDWVMSTDSFVHTNLQYDHGMLFGPSMWFPPAVEGIKSIPTPKKYFCNVLSPWLKSLCSSIYPTVNFIDLPFAVDIAKFVPSKKIGKPIIYTKKRQPTFLQNVITKINSDVVIFDYSKGYQEKDFLKSISEAPFALWIGTTESQGFAFQEILSCNTPLFVFDCKSARPQFPDPGNPLIDYLPGHSLPGTTASYFDNSCGLISSDDTWESDLQKFFDELKNYSPRKFIVDNLSPEACRKLWITKLS